MNNQTYGGNGFIGQTVHEQRMAETQKDRYADAARQGMAGVNTTVPAVPGLSSEIAVAQHSVAHLHAQIERLEHLLSDLLLPAPIKNDCIGEGGAALCDVATQVRGVRCGIDSASENLASIIDRLGL